MKLLFLGLLFFGHFAKAQSSCTDWTKTRNVSCVFAGDMADLWKRQCLEPCGYRSGSNGCANESICVERNINPNQLASNCTDWTQESGVTCLNVNSGDWEQRWVRACQAGFVALQWCSNERPPSY